MRSGSEERVMISALNEFDQKVFDEVCEVVAKDTKMVWGPPTPLRGYPLGGEVRMCPITAFVWLKTGEQFSNTNTPEAIQRLRTYDPTYSHVTKVWTFLMALADRDPIIPLGYPYRGVDVRKEYPEHWKKLRAACASVRRWTNENE